MSIIKNPDSLSAAIECTAVIAKAMTAASVYPQDGPIYQEYQKCILTLSVVADRLAQDALIPVTPPEEEKPPVDPVEEPDLPAEPEP
jgi:hypothetical protein